MNRLLIFYVRCIYFLVYLVMLLCCPVKRLLHSTNIEDALALLLTKVGSEFLVLMNLTSRGKK